MTDTTVADAIAHPLDEGVGAVADGEENATSAGFEAASVVHQYGAYVQENDLPFQNVDATNEQVDVGPGRAFVEVSGVDVQSDRTGVIDPLYDTTLPSDVVLAVEVPTAQTGLGLAIDAVNDVWLAVDLDGTITGTAGDVYLRHGSGLAAPAGPSVKLGTVDTTDGSTTRANDKSSPVVKDLTAESGTIAQADITDASAESATIGASHATQKAVATLSENNPHDVRSNEFAGALALQPHPVAENPVITADSVTDLANSRFVADPFWRPVNGQIHLFAEVKHDNNADGVESQSISHWTSPDGLTWSYDQEVVSAETDGRNYSYPWFGKHRGTWYATPSNSDAGVQIYTIDTFPTGWTEQEIVLGTYSGTDPQPVYWNGRWFLFTEDGSDFRLFYADEGETLTGRTWTEHASSPIASANAEREGPGGRPQVYDEYILLPVEDATDSNNKKLRMFYVSDLSTTSFAWDELTTSPVLQGTQTNVDNLWNRFGHHHIDVLAGEWGGDMIAITDGKEGSGGNWSLGIVQSARLKPAVAWAFRTSGSGNQSVANSTWEPLALDTAAKNTAGAYDATAFAYVAPSAGSYKASGHIRFVSASDGTLFQVRLQKSTDGGTSWSNIRFGWVRETAGAAHDYTVPIRQKFELNGGDMVRVQVRHNSGTAIDVGYDNTLMQYKQVPRW